MNRFNELEKIANENGGVLLTSAIVAAGISKPTLADFVKKNGYERVGRGIYCSQESWRDNLYLLQLRCPETVFSHETALFLLDMTDQEPFQYSVTAKTGYNPSHLAEDGVKVFTVKKDLFDLGKTEAQTPFGHKVILYDPERTVCDMIRSRSEMEIQSVQDALKRYSRRKDKNLHKLMEYANLFHVDKRLNLYLEVLL
ncbi:MAG: type IV toxin-antitoxin system AbiEi family antitoxin domain-containing protein [Eubacteriales bacterium]|nr:type IV toxin-antitoxin system AbiEi family antitoxin domain-containing protein [Eubacteriales bacterium]